MPYDPIKKYDIGISRCFDSAEEYADAIKTLVSLPADEYEAMCKRARAAAYDYDYKLLTDRVEKLF